MQQPQENKGTENKTIELDDEQKLAVNPNPRANENIKTEEAYTEGNTPATDVGSEITDGEDA